MTGYLDSARRQFQQYKSLGEKSLERLESDQLIYTPAPESNSVAVVVKHMWGNMRSRWTAFLTEDGEKPWRQRDEEFEEGAVSKETVMQWWEEGWACVFDALKDLTDEDLDRIITIRGEGHTVMDAINRQLTHYAYHVGQVVYLAKMLKGEAWDSLSIPRGGTAAFNAAKFAETGKPVR